MLTHAVGFNGTFFFFFLRRPECAACTLALCGSVGVELPLNVSTSRLCSGAISKARRPKKVDKKKAPEIHLIMCDPPLKLLVEQQSLTGFCIKYDADTELLI